MTTPRAVRAAVGLSVVTTGAAAYYMLSDGGDQETLNSRITETGAKLAETGSKIADASNKLAERGVERGTELKGKLHSWTQSAMKEGTTQENLQRNSAEESIASTNAEDGTNNADRQTSGTLEKKGTYCHTCSGPRIWFFAEKLRLKRRFTPYPDPPRE